MSDYPEVIVTVRCGEYGYTITTDSDPMLSQTVRTLDGVARVICNIEDRAYEKRFPKSEKPHA